MSKKGQKGLVDKTKAHELNMAVLKRIDPETEEVRRGGGFALLVGKSSRESSLCVRLRGAEGGRRVGRERRAPNAP